MKWLKYIAIAVAVISFVGCSEEDGGCEKVLNSKIMPGDKIPQFELTSVYGTSVIGSPVVDRLTLIYFFWSECGSCKIVTPQIMEVWKQVKNDSQVKLWCVARGGNSSSTQALAETYWQSVAESIAPVEIPKLYYDTDRRVFDMFAESGVPRCYLVDRTGTVISALVGDVTAEQLTTLISRYK